MMLNITLGRNDKHENNHKLLCVKGCSSGLGVQDDLPKTKQNGDQRNDLPTRMHNHNVHGDVAKFTDIEIAEEHADKKLDVICDEMAHHPRATTCAAEAQKAHQREMSMDLYLCKLEIQKNLKPTTDFANARPARN